MWLTGETEFETSDGDVRWVGPGSIVLAEDTWGEATSRATRTRSR